MKGFLLDTNAVLWAIFRSDRFGPVQRNLMGSRGIFISHVCAIEIAIKMMSGRLNLPENFQTDFVSAILQAANDLEAEMLPISLDDAERLSRLPLLHRDPFDRLMIAQALNHDLRVVTGDRSFVLYTGLDVLEI